MSNSFTARAVLYLALCLALASPGFIWLAHGTGSAYGTTRAVSAQQSHDNQISTGAGSILIDPSFGSGGRATTAVSSGEDAAFAVAIQNDGKIVTAGFAMAYMDFALVRYNADGSLDMAFGVGGIVRTDFNGGSDSASAILIQPDGKIIAAGEAITPPSINPHFAMARYNTDGSLDATFGSGGKVVFNASLTGDHIAALALQSDGRILAAGYADNPALPPSDASDFAIARFMTNGNVDVTFGVAGITTVDFIGKNDFANALIIQPDGTILVAGAMTSPYLQKIGLVRLTAAGMLDPGFGTGGKVVATFQGTSDSAYAILRQADGKFIVGGHSYASRYFGLARFNSDGTYDNTFANGGKRWDYLLGTYKDMRSIAFGPDGKITAFGWALNISTGYDLLIARYTANGQLDTSFGAQGVSKYDFGYTHEQAYALALQRDSKMILAGSSGTQSSRDFAVVRFYYDPPPTPVCNYSISSSEAQFSYTGGNGTVSVFSPIGCQWTASSNVPWLTVLEGATGSGDGIVRYLVLENTSASQRIGTLTIAGQTFTVTQDASPGLCEVRVVPPYQELGAAAATSGLAIFVAAECNWLVTTNVPWITLRTTSGAGSRKVLFKVSENTTGRVRTGNIFVNSFVVLINQNAN